MCTAWKMRLLVADYVIWGFLTDLTGDLPLNLAEGLRSPRPPVPTLPPNPGYAMHSSQQYRFPKSDHIFHDQMFFFTLRFMNQENTSCSQYDNLLTL